MAAEKLFETKIKKYLDSRGCWYVKYFANRNTRRGVPDILACVNGYFVAIEVKAANGRPSDIQLWQQRNIREARGCSIIVYPDQFELFKDFIEECLARPNHSPSELARNFDKE